jgi:hypothetical protein
VAIPFNAPAGAYNLIVSYAGDANYTNGGWQEEQEVITESAAGRKAVDIGLHLGTKYFTLGQQSEFTITVKAAAKNSTAIPIGYVQLYSNNGPISGQLLLSGGVASGVVEWDTVGAQNVYAVYDGDANYIGVNCVPVPVTVYQATPQLALQAGAQSLTVGSETSVTAILLSPLSSTSAPAPTGTIQFYDSLNGGAAQPVSVPQVVVGGNGGSLLSTLALSLPQGNHVITAVYSGDANWKSVASRPVSIAVKKGGS